MLRAPLARSLVRAAASRAVAGRAFHASPVVRSVGEEEKPWYLVGVAMADNLSSMKSVMNDAEKKALALGFNQRLIAEPDAAIMADRAKYLKLADTMINERTRAVAAKALEDAAQEPGAIKTPSGLIITHIEPGAGETCPPGSEVTVHYTGHLASTGAVFDSSHKRGEPATFPVDRLIGGWQEGLKMMKAGGKAKMVIPHELGYGTQGNGAIPPESVLVFDVELISFK